MADSFRPREVVTYPISIKRKRDQSDYTKDLVHQRPNSTQNRRVDPHAGKVLGIDRYVPDHSNYVPSRNAMHIQGGRHPKGGRWDASERDPGSVRPLGNANGYPTTSSDKHNGKRLNQTQSAQRVSGREQSVRRFSEISRLEESHNSGQQQVSSRPDKVNTVPVYTANAVPQCTNNEESAYRTSQTMPNAVELIKACVPTTSEQLLKSSTPDICNDASVDIAQREYSRRELQSPVESVSTSDVDRDKPDCVNSISNYSYRGVMRDTSSHKRLALEDGTTHHIHRVTTPCPPTTASGTKMGIVSSSSDISIKASSTMPIEPQKTNSTSITSPSRSKQKAIVQPTGSPFILGIQAETASLNQPEVPTKGAVLQSTHPLPPRPSWAIQTRPEPDPMSPMTETVYTPNTPFNKGSSTTDDGSPPESAMSISSGTSPSRSSSIASSRRKRANYSMNCIKCREPAIPVLKVLIRCVECQFNYHTHCHNPVVALTNGRVDVNVDTWVCSRCSKGHKVASPKIHFMLSMNRSGSTTGTPSVSSGYTPSLKRRKLDEDSRESVIVSQKAGTPHVPTGISESVLKSSPNLCPNGRTDKGSSAPLLEARGTQHLVANNNNGPVRCVSSDATHSLLEDAGLVAHKEPMEYPSTRSDVPPGLFLLEGNSVSQMENIPSTIVMADKSTTDNMNDLPPQFLKQNMMSPPEKLHIELPSEIQDSQPSQGVDGYLSEASMELDSPIEELRVSVGLQSFTEVVYDAGRTTPDKESEGSARIRSCLSSPYSPPYSPSYDFTPTSPPFYSTVSEIAPQTNVPAVIQLLAPPVPDSVPEQQTNFAPEVPTVMSLFSNLFPTILVSCTNCRAPFTIATLTVRPDGFYICPECLEYTTKLKPVALKDASAPIGTTHEVSPTASEVAHDTKSRPHLDQLSSSERPPNRDGSHSSSMFNPSVEAVKSPKITEIRLRKDMTDPKVNRQQKGKSLFTLDNPQGILEPVEKPFGRIKTATEMVQEKYLSSQKVFSPGLERSPSSEVPKGGDESQLSVPERSKERKKFTISEYSQRLNKDKPDTPEGGQSHSTLPKRATDDIKTIGEEQETTPHVTAQAIDISASTAVSPNPSNQPRPKQEPRADGGIRIGERLDMSPPSSTNTDGVDWRRRYNEQKAIVINHVKHSKKKELEKSLLEKQNMMLKTKQTELEEEIRRLKECPKEPARETGNADDTDTIMTTDGSIGKGPGDSHEESGESEKEHIVGSVLLKEIYKDHKFTFIDPRIEAPTYTPPSPVPVGRFSTVRKSEYPLVEGRNLRALHVHREIPYNSSVAPPITGFVRIDCGTPDSDLVRGGSVGNEDDGELMAFEEFIRAPTNMIPALKDGILSFRPGTLHSRHRRLERNVPHYKVGRDVPGELRGLK